MKHRIIINTAGVGVEFITSSQKLAKILNDLYQDHLLDKKDSWKIDITLCKTLDYSHFDQLGFEHTVSFPDKLWLRGDSVTAEIDFVIKSGVVSIQSNNVEESFGLFYRMFYNRMAVKNNLTLLHASCAIKDNRAYLFSGRSGAGKTTISKMIQSDQIIHDDQIVLAVENKLAVVKSMPFMGQKKYIYGKIQSFPVEKVYFLYQDTRAFLVPISSARALGRVITLPLEELESGRRNELAEYVQLCLNRCSQMVSQAKCFELHFTLKKIPKNLLKAV
jgi:hypothetical protein